jgi:hypothetical protein
VNDNDCDGTIDGNEPLCQGSLSGVVMDENQRPLAGAIVMGRPPGTKIKGESQSLPTGIDGRYSLNAVVGEYAFIARKVGYDDNITILKVTQNPIVVNFSLRNGSCHYDCTDYYNNCNPDCEVLTFLNDSGQPETCHFISSLGFAATEEITDPITGKPMIREYTCCKGEPVVYPKIKAKISSNAKNLLDQTYEISYGGKSVLLHLVVTSGNE